MFNFPAPATSWHKLCCWEESHATHTKRCNGRTSSIVNCKLFCSKETDGPLSLRIYFLWLILILTRLLEKAAPVTGMEPINNVKNIEWWEVSDGAKQVWYFRVMSDEWWVTEIEWLKKSIQTWAKRFSIWDFQRVKEVLIYPIMEPLVELRIMTVC